MSVHLRAPPCISVHLRASPLRCLLLAQVTDLFAACGDGVLLCRLVNLAEADTVDERVINLAPPNRFLVTENINLALNAAKSIGLTVINIGAQPPKLTLMASPARAVPVLHTRSVLRSQRRRSHAPPCPAACRRLTRLSSLRASSLLWTRSAGPSDIIEARPHLVLGLVWQLVKKALLSKINLKANPNLIRLLAEGETLESLLKLPPEKLLLRWFNYHLEQAGLGQRVANFGSDLKDSALYCHLLAAIDPSKKANTAILTRTSDLHERAAYVASEGGRLGAEFTVQPADIVGANEKLNLGYVAALFNACPGLEPPDETQAQTLLEELPDENEGDSREERAFRMWVNSLGLEEVRGTQTPGGRGGGGVARFPSMAAVCSADCLLWRLSAARWWLWWRTASFSLPDIAPIPFPIPTLMPVPIPTSIPNPVPTSAHRAPSRQGQFCTDLFEDVSNGVLLLQVMERVRPGVVDFSRVNAQPKSVFKRIENLNYAVSLALGPFNYSLVGVQVRWLWSTGAQ